MSSKTRTRRNNTNWNGILQDLFGEGKFLDFISVKKKKNKFN